MYRNLPEIVRPFFSSSTALATVLVVFLSLLFRLGVAKRVTFEVVPGPEAFDKITYMMASKEARGACDPTSRSARNTPSTKL